MTITRVGTNQKYASGWDMAFGGAKKAKTASAQADAAKSTTGKGKPAAKAGAKKAVVKAKMQTKAAAKSTKTGKAPKKAAKSKK